MKSLKTLIKVEKRQVDELRKEMNVLLEGKDKIVEKREKFNAQLKTERDFVMVNPDAKQSYDVFAISMNVKLQNLQHGEEDLDRRIDAKQDEVSEAFGSLKKYEILLEQKQRLEAKEIDVKVQNELNEIGLVGYNRKKRDLD